MRKLLFLFGIGSLGIGAYFYYKRQLKLLEEIEYKVSGIDILEVAPLKLLIDTTLTNKSEFTFTIKGYSFDIYINGKKVADVKNAQLNQKIKGFGGKSNIKFVTEVNSKEIGIGQGGLKGLVSGILDNIGQTDLRFKGKISVKRGLIEFSNYPVDFSFKLQDFL
tara:strand:+ start:1449 stop:1940 length:492 start_codon:yes stop_codon:yes gene_type:complete